MLEFKVGDFVKCIDNTDCEEFLTIGKEYKIINATSSCLISIIGNDNESYFYNKCRFKIVGLEKMMILKQFGTFNV